MVCLRPREIRRLTGSTSRTTTSTSCEVETILPGWTFFLGPAHFRNVDQTFNPGFQFNEGAVVGNIGDAAFQFRADRIFLDDALPWIGLKLLHAQADTLRLGVEADDLNRHGLTNRQNFRRMVDALPRNIRDVQQNHRRLPDQRRHRSR